MKNQYDSLLQDIVDKGYEFRFSEYFNSGMALFNKNAGGFIGYAAIVLFSSLAFGIIPYVGSIVYSLFSLIIMCGFYFVANDLLRDEKPDFEKFFKGFQFAGELIIAQIVMSLITLVGLIMLIIPGIYFAVSYSFTAFFIIFMKYPFWDAMEWSRKLITKNFWPIFGFFIVTAFINIGGALFCGLGLLFTMPFTACATYSAFEDIIYRAR